MNRNRLLAAVAGCLVVAISAGLLLRREPITQLEVRLDLRFGSPNAKVLVDGQVVPSPGPNFDVYGNTTLLGRGELTIDTDTLRRVGRRAPLRDLTLSEGASSLPEPTVAETNALLRAHFGLSGELIVDPFFAPHGRLSGWFEVADRNDRGLDVQVSCRMKELVWRTPDGELDCFVLVDHQQAGMPDMAAERLLVLLRLRAGRDGAYVSGHSASARPVVEGHRMRVDAEFHFTVRPCTFGSEAENTGLTLATNFEGVNRWWIAKFPPGGDLVR